MNKKVIKLSKYLNSITDETSLSLTQGKRIVAIDIDGVICSDDNSYKTYSQRKRINTTETILQKLGIDRNDVTVVLYTARISEDKETTEKWLKENKIDYDLLVTNKLPYYILIDDKAVKLD